MRAVRPIAALFAIVFLAGPALAATIIVDQSGAGDATTIPEGMAMAESGDMVVVRPGTYTESQAVSLPWGTRVVNVVMKDGVHLVSEQGAAVTIIDGSGEIGYGVLFPETVAHATLEGFTVRNVFVGCYVWQSQPLITKNLFLDHGAEAVQMREAMPMIVSNTIVGVGSYGIRAQLNSTAIIENNIVAFGDAVGIFCEVPGSVIECNNVFGHPLDYDGNCAPLPSNISEDPEFCLPQGGNFQIAAGSPCAPANAPAGCGLVGAFPVGCGAIPVETGSWGMVKGLFR